MKKFALYAACAVVILAISAAWWVAAFDATAKATARNLMDVLSPVIGNNPSYKMCKVMSDTVAQVGQSRDNGITLEEVTKMTDGSDLDDVQRSAMNGIAQIIYAAHDALPSWTSEAFFHACMSKGTAPGAPDASASSGNGASS